MMRLFELLFCGKKPVNITAAVSAVRVEPQRRELAKQLQEIDRSYKKIDVEAKKMKRRIDTALAIAMSTGGLQ
jgi:hypothetical protein